MYSLWLWYLVSGIVQLCMSVNIIVQIVTSPGEAHNQHSVSHQGESTTGIARSTMCSVKRQLLPSANRTRFVKEKRQDTRHSNQSWLPRQNSFDGVVLIKVERVAAVQSTTSAAPSCQFAW
jgi:hypothetical protein